MTSAVPEVQSSATGSPPTCAAPSAMNPAERSSTITATSISGCRQSATANGVDRDPGEITANRSPDRASSSAKTDARAVLALVGSIGAGDAELHQLIHLLGEQVDAVRRSGGQAVRLQRL